MFKRAAAGLAVFLAGAVRFALHLGRSPTLEDYLAFRCAGSAAADSFLLPGTLLSLGHCWGCGAMAAGAGLMAWVAVSRRAPGPRRRGAAGVCKLAFGTRDGQ
ncbi:MAG: hypothetical protein ACO33A_05380 [Hyphomonas sp.]